MASILDVITLNLTLESALPSSAALGKIMVVGTNVAFAAVLAKEYSSAADLLADDDAGLTSGDYEYKAVAKIFSQKYKPATVWVGKLGAFTAQLDTNEITTEADGDWVQTINGIDYTYPSTGSETPAVIMAGIVAACSAVPDVTVAAGAGAVYTLTADNVGQPFTASLSAPSPGVATEETTDDNNGYYEELGLILAEEDDWWCLVMEHRDGYHILESGRWSEDNGPRLLVAQTSEAEVITNAATDVASVMNGLNYVRSALWYFSDDAVVCAEAIAGMKVSCDPDTDTTTWCHATLNGITPDVLTTGEQGYALGKKCNIYVKDPDSRGATFKGTLIGSDGHYIDSLVSRDWLELRLSEDVRGLFRRYSNMNSKVPYTDGGINLVSGTIRRRLTQGEEKNHFIDGESTVTFPRRADVDQADVDARKLSGTFKVVLQGAIHEVTTTGTLTTTLG